MDPAELAKHSNLVEHLLTSVSNNTGQATSFVSIVLSLLSNLCRGSATVTEQVLRFFFSLKKNINYLVLHI